METATEIRHECLVALGRAFHDIDIVHAEVVSDEYKKAQARLVEVEEYLRQAKEKLAELAPTENTNDICPECLRTCEREELETFGGFCERCREPLDED